MRNRINVISGRKQFMNEIIRDSSRGHGFEFGLGCEMIFKNSVRKAKMQGFIAGQAVSLYHLIAENK